MKMSLTGAAGGAGLTAAPAGSGVAAKTMRRATATRQTPDRRVMHSLAEAGEGAGGWTAHGSSRSGGRMSVERPDRQVHEAGPAISVVRPGNAEAPQGRR